MAGAAAHFELASTSLDALVLPAGQKPDMYIFLVEKPFDRPQRLREFSTK